VLNAELIRFIDARPDTYITLTTGERLIVRESVEEVVRRAMEYQQRKFLFPHPTAPNLTAALGADSPTPTRGT
jgi:flagellar protein FlbD